MASNNRYFMVSTVLAVEFDRLLQHIGEECRRLGGAQIPRAVTLGALTRVLQAAFDSGQVELRGVASEDDLVERLTEAFGLSRSSKKEHAKGR